MTRFATILLVALLLAPALPAAERDPWAGEAGEERERMEELAEAEARGDLEPDERRELERYWAMHLRRCAMNAIESALYSAAEIHLRRRNAKQAIATLEKLLDAKPRDELRNLTHLNIAEICRRQLNDTAQAAKHYRLVAGPQRHLARNYLLRMLAETGKPEAAAKNIEEFIKDATEKGEKLALLHRLATHYKRFEMPDQALAVYERIATQFTAKDIEEMRQAVAAEVRATIEKIIQRRENDNERDWEQAERLERQIHRRARELRLAKRWDEVRAFEEAADRGLRQLRRHEEELERRERERDEEAERRERGDDDPDDRRREHEF